MSKKNRIDKNPPIAWVIEHLDRQWIATKMNGDQRRRLEKRLGLKKGELG